ncbi:patatin-like phospholipase family protein [Polaribacter sargassicola]|uniref:patatin-like phospholipase family protein n=1 Tax=Polaribacter sargassicola TaxID=2836891 RepID=UPI001F1D1514|nr:patatin-like phospholipase family protein [Polaribacter sp. DS7-9]MCG1034886.1 patatin-like phospholipase family protein [Polaribacter sp. DS7-9]
MKKYIIAFFLLFTIVFHSQEKQPKIGLVLSGGGAKGFAYVGILKEIDKAGLQLDYIGGTSMGAIVGGLYAIGYSGEQIEKIILETDFIPLLQDKLPRKAEPFFEKEFGERTILTLPISEGNIGLPRAVSKGQNILNLLIELLSSVEGISDFRKLPIPFFCIATDVENGNQILLEKGSLPLALRASGSFPTLLNPVALDDKLLVDGGLANNFPISIMKAKGIDLVIGVDVEGKLNKKDKLNSAVDILSQLVNYQMYNKTDQEKKNIDIYIHPDTYGFGVVDFDKKEEILEKGTIEGAKFSDVFKKLAANQKNKKERKKLFFDDKKYLISEIDLNGSYSYTRAFVLGKINIKEGDTLSRKEITQKIYQLSSTKNYDRIEYSLHQKKDSTYKINFLLKESLENANLKLGFHFDNLYKTGVLANYNQKHLLINNDMFSLDLILGDNLRYNLNYFVDNGFYTSYGLTSRYNHFSTNSRFNILPEEYPNISRINLKYTDITNQFFLQTTFNRKFAIGLGLEHKYLKATTETISISNEEETIFDNSNYLNSYGYIKLDTYDKKYFPTKGYFADFNFKWYMSSSDYNDNFISFAQAKGTFGFAKSYKDKLTLKVTNEAGFTLREVNSDFFDFYLGGYNKNFINNFYSFYGYEMADLSNDSFIKTELNLSYAFNSNSYVSFIANYAKLDDNVFRNLKLFNELKSGYAVGYSYNSFFGPIELKYSWSPDNRERYWLFNFGFWF